MLPNEPPHALSLAVEVISASQTVFEGRATDAEGNLQRLDFYVSGPEVGGGYTLRASVAAMGSDATESAIWAPTAALAPGTYYARLIAVDESGASSTETVEAAFNVVAAQEIAFAEIADRLTTDVPFALDATASSGLPVSYAVISGPATVNGNMLTLAGTAGTVVIRASQAGNGTYAAAPSVDRSFNVAAPIPPPVITSPTSVSGTYGTAFSYPIAATNSPTGFSASGLPNGLSIDAVAGTITGAPLETGTFGVTIGASNGSGTGTATLTLTIAKAVPVGIFADRAFDESSMELTLGMLDATFVHPSNPAIPGPTGNLSYWMVWWYDGQIVNPVGKHINRFHSEVITANCFGDDNYAEATVSATFSCIDTEPPSTPGAPEIGLLGPTSFAVTWTPSTDNFLIRCYEVSLDDGAQLLTTRHTTEVAQVTPPTIVVSDLLPGTTHTVTVRAIDWFENSSAWSATTTVSTPLTGPEPLQAPRWADVNNDGLRDEIVGADTGLLSYFVVEESSETVSYSSWTWDFQLMPWFSFDDGLEWFVSGWWVPDEEETTEIINTVRPAFQFMTEPGYDYALCRAVTDPQGASQYYRIANFPSLPGDPGGIKEWLPASFWPEDAFYMFPTVLARIAKPVGGIEIGGVNINVGAGGGQVTIPGLGTVTVSGSGQVSLPTSVPGIISVNDAIDNLIHAIGPRVVWEVWDMVTNATLNIGGQSIGLDLGVSLSGQLLIGVKLDDRAPIWFQLDVQRTAPPQVQVVDKDQAPVSQLKVAKLTENYVLLADSGVAYLIPDDDSDRFYIRVIDPSRRGQKPKARVWTEAPDGTYSDNGTNEIELDDDPSDSLALISKSMLLMSDSVDDQHQVNGVPDNALNDRTRRIALGGTVKVEYLGHKTQPTNQPDVQIPVPARTVKPSVSVKAVILKLNSGSSDGLIAAAEVESDLKCARERFAQVGVKFTYSIVGPFAPPTGVNLEDIGGLTAVDPFDSTLHAEAKAMIDGFRTESSGFDICVYYVNQIQRLSVLVEGVSIPAMNAATSGSAYINHAFVAADRSVFVMAHELAHLLVNSDHEPSSLNLLHPDPASNNTIVGPKRLDVSQEAAVHGNTITQQ